MKIVSATSKFFRMFTVFHANYVRLGLRDRCDTLLLVIWYSGSALQWSSDNNREWKLVILITSRWFLIKWGQSEPVVRHLFSRRPEKCLSHGNDVILSNNSVWYPSLPFILSADYQPQIVLKIKIKNFPDQPS